MAWALLIYIYLFIYCDFVVNVSMTVVRRAMVEKYRQGKKFSL